MTLSKPRRKPKILHSCYFSFHHDVQNDLTTVPSGHSPGCQKAEDSHHAVTKFRMRGAISSQVFCTTSWFGVKCSDGFTFSHLFKTLNGSVSHNTAILVYVFQGREIEPLYKSLSGCDLFCSICLRNL